MSKRHKSKGSVYEREFVQRVRNQLLPAHRVPLSGAMRGYKDDVVVADVVRVECKFRAKGAGFSRLHSWHPGPGKALHLPESNLFVYRLGDWCDIVRAMVDNTASPTIELVTKNVTPRKVMLDWMGEADALALRKPHEPWLICIKGTE